MADASRHRDRLGLELTAANGYAARAFDDTVWAYVGFSRDPGVPLKRALQADPAMPAMRRVETAAKQPDPLGNRAQGRICPEPRTSHL